MPPRPATYRDIVLAEAKAARVPETLAFAILQEESGGRPDAISPKGAQGFFQLMPETATDLGLDAADPVQNIRAGLTYFRQQLDAHGGDVSKALAAYNMGPTAYAQAGKPFPETDVYIKRVLGRLQPQQTPPTQQQAAPARAGHRVSTLPSELPDAALGIAPPTLPMAGGRRPGAPPNPAAFERPPAYGGGMEGSTFDPEVQRIEAAKTELAARTDLGSGAPPQPTSLLSKLDLDPRTRSGLQNLGGMVGGMGGTATAVKLGITGLRGATLPILGAMAGGGAAEAGTQVAETGAVTDPGAVAKAGAWQGAYEQAGQLFMWPIKASGRRLISTSVGQRASQALKAQREALTTTLQSALDTAQDAIRGIRRGNVTRTEAARTTAEQLTQAATPTVGPPAVTAARAGQQAAEAIRGPAQGTLDVIGQGVEDAAQSGPPVSFVPVKDKLRSAAEAMIPSGQREAGAIPGFSPEQARAIAARNPEVSTALAQQVLPEGHPLPGILDEIAQLPDEISFADAHILKRRLDDAVNWDRTAKKQAEQISKGVRITLREAMTGHAPYDAATRAYETTVPLFRRGIAPKFLKQAADNPEALISLITPKSPSRVRMLQDLLTAAGPGGTGSPQGQAAWDAIRSAWTHEKVMKGDIAQLGSRLANLDPEFVATLYGDQTGKQVFDNLQTIAKAYQTAVDQGKSVIQAAKRSGRQDLAQAEDLAVALTRQKRGAKRPTAEEEAFIASSLTRFVRKDIMEREAADVIRALALGPGSLWGGISIARLLHGPRSSELVRWAAYSPQGTQLLVHVLTHPEAGMAASNLIRLSGLGDEVQRLSRPPEEEEAGPPPPSRGGPPPLPRILSNQPQP